MTKFTAFVIIVALRIVFHPSHAQTDMPPFASACQDESSRRASPCPATGISMLPAKLISITGSIRNHIVTLHWVVGENETADKFEVEKSINGKPFTMAALVFGTDKPENDKYQFYEKAVHKKILYRIKLINKNRQAEYSAIIEINPTV